MKRSNDDDGCSVRLQVFCGNEQVSEDDVILPSVHCHDRESKYLFQGRQTLMRKHRRLMTEVLGLFECNLPKGDDDPNLQSHLELDTTFVICVCVGTYGVCSSPVPTNVPGMTLKHPLPGKKPEASQRSLNFSTYRR